MPTKAEALERVYAWVQEAPAHSSLVVDKEPPHNKPITRAEVLITLRLALESTPDPDAVRALVEADLEYDAERAKPNPGRPRMRSVTAWRKSAIETLRPWVGEGE